MSDFPKSTRLFVAFLLPDTIKHELIRAQKAIRHLNLAWGSYVREEHLHLTLNFLGHVDSAKIPEIITALGSVKAETFELRLGSIGVFPQRGFPIRTVWVSLLSDNLDNLVNNIKKALIEFCLPENNSYHAHLTLLRVKKISRMKHFLDGLEHIKLKQLLFVAQEFVLMESVLTHEGPRYEILQRFVL